MTPQELKNSILQLAIQGRLVEQRPEEGTAEELYRQIQREKAALVKAGKIKKEKSLPEIAEDEVPFEIPEGWKWVPLCAVATINGGYAFKSSSFSSEGIRVIRISDFNENGFINCKIVRHPYSKEYAPFLLETNNILLCMTGGTVGKSYFVSNMNEQMMVNQRVATIKIFGVLPEYINYNILAPLVQSIIRQSKNSTNDNISMETINNFPIPLPPLAEQKRIVAKIEELLPYIDRYEAAWSRLDDFNKRFPTDMQKSILQLAIQGKLVPQRPEEGTGEELYQQIQAEKQSLIRSGKLKKEKPLPEISPDEIPFDIPESWMWVRFSDLMKSMSTGPFGSMLHKADYVENGIPLVNPANIVNGHIIPSGKMMVSEETKERLSSYVLERNMIVMGRRGEMGRCAVVTENEEGWLCGTGSFFMAPYEKLYISYISWLFATPYAKSYLGGESIGTTMSNLNHKILSKMPVPLPPIAEQKRIVAKLEELLHLCKRLK